MATNFSMPSFVHGFVEFRWKCEWLPNDWFASMWLLCECISFHLSKSAQFIMQLVLLGARLFVRPFDHRFVVLSLMHKSTPDHSQQATTSAEMHTRLRLDNARYDVYRFSIFFSLKPVRIVFCRTWYLIQMFGQWMHTIYLPCFSAKSRKLVSIFKMCGSRSVWIRRCAHQRRLYKNANRRACARAFVCVYT